MRVGVGVAPYRAGGLILGLPHTRHFLFTRWHTTAKIFCDLFAWEGIHFKAFSDLAIPEQLQITRTSPTLKQNGRREVVAWQWPDHRAHNAGAVGGHLDGLAQPHLVGQDAAAAHHWLL